MFVFVEFGPKLVARSCNCRSTSYIVPNAEGGLPDWAVFGGGDEMAAELKVRMNAAVGG